MTGKFFKFQTIGHLKNGDTHVINTKPTLRKAEAERDRLRELDVWKDVTIKIVPTEVP